MKKVGIPQGLFYYYYYPLWKTFFEDLGAEVLTSSPTNRLTVESGIDAAVDEACFPIKVYYGHVRELCKHDIDYLFLPRMVSIEARSYICPKFMGLPDMIRAGVSGLPELICPTVDISKTDKHLKRDIVKVGQLFTHSKKDIQKAYRHGLEQVNTCRNLAREGYTMFEAIRVWEGEDIELPEKSELKIGVLGHGYSLYDQVISMNIIERLREMQCQVQLVEMLDCNKIESEAATMQKRIFWTLGRLMAGSAFHMSKDRNIDGIIYLTCFGCGPDSLIGEIIERKIKEKPFMLITVDEHTGEAGLITRLEAFCDMLKRRRLMEFENNFSAHG